MLLGDKVQTYKDDKNTSANDILYNTIGFGLAGVFGYFGLYKTGALRAIVSPMLELANTIAREGSDKAGLTMQTIKQWTKLQHLSSAQLATMKNPQQWNVAKYSIFRNRDSTIAYDIWEDLKEGVKSSNFDFFRVKRVIEGTADDLNTLQSMIKHNVDNIGDYQKDFSKTDLYRQILNLEEFIKISEHETGGKLNSIPYRRRYIEEFIEAFSTTPEKTAQELRESGYRKLTLKDIAHVKDGKLELNSNAPIDIGTRSNPLYQSLLEKINKQFGENSYNTYNGKTILSGDKWQDIIIDSALRINENGNIIDYRMTRNNMIDFAHSLANDFKLPLVGFNPLKSIFGLDKIGRTTPFGGFIAPGQFVPGMTMRGGRDMNVGQYLAENLGRGYKNSPVAIINGKAYVHFNNEHGNAELLQIGKGFKLHDITDAARTYGLKPTVNAERQIAGLDVGSPYNGKWEEYEKKLIDAGVPVTRAMEYKYKLGQLLDIGHQEARVEDELTERLSLDSASNVDEWVNKLIYDATSAKPFRVSGYEYETVSKMVEDIRANGYTYKNVFGEGFSANGDYKPRMYHATREHFKISEIVEAAQRQNWEETREASARFVSQFFVGRNRATNEMHENFTEWSGGLPWLTFNALSEAIGSSSHLLGLSIDSKSSTGELMKNLLLKRALPVYGLTQVPGMINYLSEPFFGDDDEDGNPDNITKWLMRGVKRFDLGAHSLMDLTGATNVFKFLGEMTPGSDQINELPVIYQLGLGQTREEREDYIENGYDPMRKGRFWSSGNTPFTGGKIMYYRPNLYRRVEADVDFSDSKWGSRQEYYNHTWYPNIVNPFAPINHFILDRNHYDQKHYYDRPYLKTSPVGADIPIVGPMFSATVGKVIDPQTKMHMEYWRNGLQPLPGDEDPSTLLTEGRLVYKPNIFNNYAQDIHAYNEAEKNTAQATAEFRESLYTSAYQAKQIVNSSFTDFIGIVFQTWEVNIDKLKQRSYDKRYDNPYEVYSTPSGNLSIVDIPQDMNLYNVNQDLARWSINKVIGTNQRVNLIDNFQGPGIPVGNDSRIVDNEFMTMMGEQFNTLADVAGLRGFAIQGFLTGEANQHALMIENSGYAYSMNRSFWDINAGGLGGNLSEITRRFIPDRNKNIEYINPIRNTMPEWMPGSDYFTDFKHGDPYVKVPNGEERLPGEGYERLHGMNKLMNLSIGSSYIGYSQEDIVKHLLNQDGYISSFEEDTFDKGNKIHKMIENNWVKAGFAVDTEGKIEDKRNDIIGYYDAIIVDITSPTGMGIADIKTTSAKKLEQIRKSGQPLDQHKRQVNYYLWATGSTSSKGYIYYVDKENLNNSEMISFNYDHALLEDTLKNVYEARKTVRDAIDKGIIGRGELYKPLDKFRILADVAPYSQEYKDAAAAISREKLSDKDKKEVQQIRDRVTKQKEPLRVYPYKFKTSNLKTQTVTVDRVIDNNTIVTKEYGRNHAVKFAGIRVSESKSEYYKSHKEKFTDKKGRERERTVGVTMHDAANKQIRKYIRPGQRITIQYDADAHNKFSKDSTQSIQAVVKSRGRNVNQLLLNKGLAKEKENDDSPAAIRARYTNGEIAFGSAMETLTHGVIGKIPFIGSKWLQVRSPYEQYREREVYGKDFQSWNHPIRDILVPNIQKNVGEPGLGGALGVMTGAFIGSLFGRNPYGKIVGTVVGGGSVLVGKGIKAIGSTKEREWRPERRRKQEALNEYVDTLKYVKNMRLYEQYKTKAMKENNFDVDMFMRGKKSQGYVNKFRQRELTDYKKKVKLDFKHRDRYNFKYGAPKYVQQGMSRKDTIGAINREISELQGQRKVTKIPLNAMKAIDYKQRAEKTMYGYNPGDSLVNIMSALPKKDRQYFKHFVDAPEEEKQKILRIAPSYLRRALQTSWGMPVDRKPSLQEYFQHHALPDANWIGWDENVDMDAVKVKMVHRNKLDPGEFDIWDKDEVMADKVTVPIPNINATNNPMEVSAKLKRILGQANYEDIRVDFSNSIRGDNTKMHIKRDARPYVEAQINDMEI